MLELFQPVGAFETLEAYLAEELWGREGRVADVFLGYGISQEIRRDASPPPPEPCSLPLLACRVREETPSRKRQSNRLSLSRFRIGSWERSWADGDYLAAVEDVRTAIARGDVYQVNLVRHLSAPFAGEPGALADALTPLRPVHGAALAGSGWTIVSASPERFLSGVAASCGRARSRGRGRPAFRSRARRTRPSTS